MDKYTLIAGVSYTLISLLLTPFLYYLINHNHKTELLRCFLVSLGIVVFVNLISIPSPLLLLLVFVVTPLAVRLIFEVQKPKEIASISVVYCIAFFVVSFIVNFALALTLAAPLLQN